MKKLFIAALAVVGIFALMTALVAVNVEAKEPNRGQLYYDGAFVDALIPQKGRDGGDVTFKELPENSKAYPFDPIYVFVDENTGMPHAQPPVIGSIPGDKEYTGGRWHVFLVFGTEAVDDDITSVYDLMMSGLEIHETNMYFVCPIVMS
jgi:hypothetical protein